MPRARARARKAATHCSNGVLLACARAVALHAAMAAARPTRQARRDRGGLIHMFAFRVIPRRSTCPHFIGIVAFSHLISFRFLHTQCVGSGVCYAKVS